jgi:hypothetical protein
MWAYKLEYALEIVLSDRYFSIRTKIYFNSDKRALNMKISIRTKIYFDSDKKNVSIRTKNVYFKSKINLFGQKIPCRRFLFLANILLRNVKARIHTQSLPVLHPRHCGHKSLETTTPFDHIRIRCT